MEMTLMPFWALVGIAAFEVLLIGLVLFPARVLATWLRWLRVVPIVGTPGGLRAVSAMVFILFTFMLVVNTRAWLSL
jgi:hypothetical protein